MPLTRPQARFPKHLLASTSLLLVLAAATPALALTSQQIDQHWDYAHPAVSEQHFRRLASEHEDNLNEYLEILTQVARAQGLQGHFNQAHETLDTVREANHQDSPRLMVRYWLERGRVLNSSGHPASAVPLFKSALKLAQKEGLDFYAIDAAHMLGIAASAREQAYWTETALKIAEDSRYHRCKGWLGTLYNNLGWTYFDQMDYAKALKTFKQGVQWRQQQNQTGEEEIIARWAVARTERAMGHYSTALYLQRQLQQDIAVRKLPEDGYVHEELAENLLAMGQTEAAKPHFQKAWQLLSQDRWLQTHEADRLQRLKKMGGA